jgi:hypothetical protein
MGHRDPAQASDRLTTAVADFRPGQARSRTIDQIKLASLTMATGDPIEAAALGTAALESAGAVRSRRVAEDLRELGRRADRCSGVGEVDELRRRITATVSA